MPRRWCRLQGRTRSLLEAVSAFAAWLDEDRFRSRVFVLAIVVLLHLMFYQMLGHGQDGQWVARSQDRVLRVEFIERTPRPAVVVPESAEDAPLSAAPVARASVNPGKPTDNAREKQPALSAIPVDATGPTTRPLALDWQAPAEVEPGFQPSLPEEDVAFPTELNGPDRIRVRRQVSGQQVVEGAAQLLGFWPAGYESDPCPRVKRNISGLMTDTRPEGREALGEELRRQRVACRQ